MMKYAFSTRLWELALAVGIIILPPHTKSCSRDSLMAACAMSQATPHQSIVTITKSWISTCGKFNNVIIEDFNNYFAVGAVAQ